jgi:hypothetical protein
MRSAPLKLLSVSNLLDEDTQGTYLKAGSESHRRKTNLKV